MTFFFSLSHIYLIIILQRSSRYIDINRYENTKLSRASILCVHIIICSIFNARIKYFDILFMLGLKLILELSQSPLRSAWFQCLTNKPEMMNEVQRHNVIAFIWIINFAVDNDDDVQCSNLFNCRSFKMQFNAMKSNIS